MTANLPPEILRIIESIMGKKSFIVSFTGKTPLSSLCDLSFYLRPYIFDRSRLLENPNLISLLEKGLYDIDWRLLSRDLYQIDYNSLIFRPSNIFRERTTYILECNTHNINWFEKYNLY